jgi:hypothetical protein
MVFCAAFLGRAVNPDMELSIASFVSLLVVLAISAIQDYSEWNKK